MIRNRITRRQFSAALAAAAAAAGRSGHGARAAELSQPPGSLHPAVRRGRRRRHHVAAGGGEARREARAALRGGKSAGAGRHRRGARRALAAARRPHHRPRDQRHLDQRGDLQGAAVRPGQGFCHHLDHRRVRSRARDQRGFRAQDAADFIKAARAQPGKLNVGTINVGGTQNLAAELLKSSAGLNFQIVPYRGTPDVIVALLRNDVQLMVDFYAPMKPTLLDKKIRALATSGPRALAVLPRCPDRRRSGRARLRGDVLERHIRAGRDACGGHRPLNKTIREIVAIPEVKQRYAELGIEAKASTPEELKARLEADIAKWAAVIERAGIPKQ